MLLTKTYDDNIGTAVLLTGVLFTFLTGSVIYFVVLYRNKQLKNKQEQEKLEADFRQELLQSQIEIQEQTLEHISKEIHDNITQVLSFVKLSLAGVGNSLDEIKKAKINESRELISQTITDLRDLSKSLSFEHITSLGLAQTMQIEVDRINKSGIIGVTFTQEGTSYSLGGQRELVLFRIFQEALNNSLKHSGAKHFKILLQYHPDLLNLTLEDNGSGFSRQMLDNKTGAGLRNMENRAVLIGGTASIDSSPGKGCRIQINLDPLKQQFDNDGGPHPNRFS